MLHITYVGSVHARSLTRAHTCTVMYMSAVFCITPDTIAYAKVSGADNIAWRTQLHLTPFLTMFYTINHYSLPSRVYANNYFE